MKLFAVVTADVIDSKKYPEVTRDLKAVLPKLHGEGLVNPFTVSRGDEIQAVYEQWEKLPGAIRQLRFFCRPYALRVGVGIGPVDSNWVPGLSSWEMNGPAFIQARQAIDMVKKEKTQRTVWLTGVSEIDLAVNTIYGLMDAIMAEWTKEQWEAVHTYQEAGTLEKAAEILGIAHQNVFKRCQAAKWDRIREAESQLANLLNSRVK